MARQRRVLGSGIGPWWTFAILVLKPLLLLCTRRDWRGLEHLTRPGGVIVAANHISHVDPLVLADYVVFGCRRLPRFLAKSTLFGRGLVGAVMRGAGQIPVYRGTADASLALRDAVAALQRGECVVIYPEGTVSRDPEKWPMRAKTGVARLALLSGAPVVPLGQWGAERLLDSYRSERPRFLPPKRVVLEAGPPVDLSAYAGLPLSAEVLRAATDDVMAAVTAQVQRVRGGTPPAAPFEWATPRRERKAS